MAKWKINTQNNNKFNYGIGVLLRTGFGSSFQFINRKQN
jgi:hypothetical protein